MLLLEVEVVCGQLLEVSILALLGEIEVQCVLSQPLREVYIHLLGILELVLE